MDKRIRQRDIEGYRIFLQEQEKSRLTIEKYIRDAYKLYHYLGDDKQINKQKLLEFKQVLLKQYTAVSINSILGGINGFLAYIGRPGCRIKRLKTQRQIFCSEEKELKKEDYASLLRTAKAEKKERLYLIMLTLCGTGIRVSELPYIRAEALQSGRIQVTCKNKTRLIFIPRKLRCYLQEYARTAGIKQGPVFAGRSGKALDRSSIWRGMKALCINAGVKSEKVFPHNLRHLFARTFYQKEQDIVKLADILGHSSVETTRIYTISTGREHEKQICRLGLIM